MTLALWLAGLAYTYLASLFVLARTDCVFSSAQSCAERARLVLQAGNRASIGSHRGYKASKR
jgi:hypothetical protein